MFSNFKIILAIRYKCVLREHRDNLIDCWLLLGLLGLLYFALFSNTCERLGLGIVDRLRLLLVWFFIWFVTHAIFKLIDVDIIAIHLHISLLCLLSFVNFIEIEFDQAYWAVPVHHRDHLITAAVHNLNGLLLKWALMWQLRFWRWCWPNFKLFVKWNSNHNIVGGNFNQTDWLFVLDLAHRVSGWWRLSWHHLQIWFTSSEEQLAVLAPLQRESLRAIV